MFYLLTNETSKYADIVLDSLKKHEALVPAICTLEVGNVVLVSERRKRLTESDVNEKATLSIDIKHQPPNSDQNWHGSLCISG
jgi:anaerobic selenocysteine-containing dehydrogenase